MDKAWGGEGEEVPEGWGVGLLGLAARAFAPPAGRRFPTRLGSPAIRKRAQTVVAR